MLTAFFVSLLKEYPQLPRLPIAVCLCTKLEGEPLINGFYPVNHKSAIRKQILDTPNLLMDTESLNIVSVFESAIKSRVDFLKPLTDTAGVDRLRRRNCQVTLVLSSTGR